MTRARYLLRFDDLCPTMNWKLWDEVEAILERHQLRPLLAVVPDNQDPELQFAPPALGFWSRVRNWQARGWNIALHGLHHKFITSDPGLVGVNQLSEFAGLSASVQKEKLARALAIFRQENIIADAWAAPAHSFDQTTLNCLAEFGLQIVSDGLFLFPQTDAQGFFWLPQQLSDFRSFPIGVFTICFHPNHWNQSQLRAFEQKVIAYRNRITSLQEIHAAYQHRQPWLSAALLTKWGSTALRIKQRLRLRSRILSSGREKLSQEIVP